MERIRTSRSPDYRSELNATALFGSSGGTSAIGGKTPTRTRVPLYRTSHGSSELDRHRRRSVGGRAVAELTRTIGAPTSHAVLKDRTGVPTFDLTSSRRYLDRRVDALHGPSRCPARPRGSSAPEKSGRRRAGPNDWSPSIHRASWLPSHRWMHLVVLRRVGRCRRGGSGETARGRCPFGRR